MKLSIIIPTKNRPHDLTAALWSVVSQSRPLDELIIVDQSSERLSEKSLEEWRSALPHGAALIYLYDPSIRGLVHAKDVGVKAATGDLVAFLEDDVELEADYLLEIGRAFEDPAIIGCCGVVSNLPNTGRAYVVFHEIFHRGLFRDPRPRIFRDAAAGQMEERVRVPSWTLSGGLSAWRSVVFREVPFDTSGRFHMLEDLEFSTRVYERFRGGLFVVPAARLAHHFAPMGRAGAGARHQRKVTEYILFYRLRRRFPAGSWELAWLILGVTLSATSEAIASRSLAPVTGVLKGVMEGCRVKVTASG